MDKESFMPFFVRQTAKHSTKTMPLNPFGRHMAVKRTNKNQRISCPPNEKTLPLQSKTKRTTNDKNKIQTLKNRKIMKKFLAAIVLCLVCTVCFGQSIVCPTDSTPIILPGYVHANDTMTVFDLVPNTTNTIEIYKGDALYNSFSTSSCVYEFKIQDAGEYIVIVKNPYVTHDQKIIVLPLEVQPETDSIAVQNSTQK